MAELPVGVNVEPLEVNIPRLSEFLGTQAHAGRR